MPVPVLLAPALAPAAPAIGPALSGAVQGAALAGLGLLIQNLQRQGQGPDPFLPGPPGSGRGGGQGLLDMLSQLWGGMNQQLQRFLPAQPNGKDISHQGNYNLSGYTSVRASWVEGEKGADNGPNPCIPYGYITWIGGSNGTFNNISGVSYRTQSYANSTCGPEGLYIKITHSGGETEWQVGDAVGSNGFLKWAWPVVTFTPAEGATNVAPASGLGPAATTENVQNFPDRTEFLPDAERRLLAPPLAPPFSPPYAPPLAPPGDPATEPPTPRDPGEREQPKAPPIPYWSPSQAPNAPPPPGQGPAETGVGVQVGPLFRPGTGPAPVPIGVDGRPISQPGAGPITTPNNQTNIGTTVIPGTGPAPRPDLQGIATEVGKIERKLELMMLKPDPVSPENPAVNLSRLTDLIQLVANLLQQVYEEGSYTLTPPCEGGGYTEVEWEDGFGAFGQVNAKLDALAALLQAHKNMRQPICRQKASGEEVTVIFEEI